jgi:hypothetical protein
MTHFVITTLPKESPTESTEGTNLTEWAQSVLLIESRSKRQSQRAAMTSLRTLAAARILRENGGKR